MQMSSMAGARRLRAVAALITLIGVLALPAVAWVPAAEAATPGAPATSGAARPDASQAGGVFVPVTPTRVEDTRGAGPVVGRLAGGGSVSFTVPTSLVPAGSSAVAINVTAAAPSGGGNLVAYATGTTKPPTSTVNYDPGRDVANAAIIPLSPTNGLTVTNNSPTATDVVVDMDGYFTATAGSGGAGHYYPLTPARIDDTRPGTGQPDSGRSLTAGSTLNVQVTGHGGVPSSGVQAVVLNLTATNVTAGSDFLSAYPTGGAQPLVSSLNLPAGDTRANRVITSVSSAGAVTIYNNLGAADVIVDVAGYFSDGSGASGGGNLFTPVTPARVLDTRGGTMFSQKPTVTALTGQGGLPTAGVTAAALNVTEVDSASVTSGSTYLTTSPAGASAPGTSDINYPMGDTRPNLDIATLSAGGQLAGIVGSGTADVLYDVTGYFSPPTGAGTLAVTTATLPSGTVGTAYSATLSASGGTSPYTWTATGLPAGLTLSTTGAITGTPTTAGTTNPSFTVTDSTGATATATIALTVTPSTVTPQETSYEPALADGTATSCASTSVCTVVGSSGSYGGVIVGTTNGGGTWTTETALAPTSTLSGVSCPTTTTCVAVGSNYTSSSSSGEILSTTNGGATWSAQTVPTGVGTLNAVSCPSATTCTAVGGVQSSSASGSGGVAITTSNGGATWTTEVVPTAVQGLAGVSCPTTTACTAVGTASTANGSGGAIITTTNAGGNWTSQAVPAAVGSLTGVSCATPTSCTAVGSTSSGTGAVVATTDGMTWTSQTIPSNLATVDGVSCPTTSACTAVGTTTDNPTLGSVIATTNGGTTWTQQTTAGAALYGVSCPTTASCAATGYQYAAGGSVGVLLATANAGATWTPAANPLGIDELEGTSCPTQSTCFAVGDSGSSGVVIATTNAGATWTVQTVPAGLGELYSVSCATPSTCTAVGSTTIGGDGLAVIIATTNGGGTWTEQTAPTDASGSTVGDLYGVSCPSATSCTAVGHDADPTSGAYDPLAITTANGGASWTTQTLPSGAGDLYGVSCPTTTACTAVGDSETNVSTGATAPLILAESSASWAAQTAPSGVADLYGVSCPSTTACTAVGDSASSGAAISTTNGGTSWTAQTVPSTTSVLYGVSCPSATACTAVGTSTSGAAALISTTSGGASWTSPTLPADLSTLYTASCPTTTACASVGINVQGGGSAYIAPPT